MEERAGTRAALVELMMRRLGAYTDPQTGSEVPGLHQMDLGQLSTFDVMQLAARFAEGIADAIIKHEAITHPAEK